MKRLKASILGLALVLGILANGTSNAQSTEERFQDIFITAGYATAFGAALGAASLSFFDNPTDHLRYVAIGASLGFIGGSLLGSYMVFSPVVSTDELDTGKFAMINPAHSQPGTIGIRPNYNPNTKRVSWVESSLTLATF